MNDIKKPLKNNILVKLIGYEEYVSDGIIIPTRRQNTSTQVEIINIPDQEFYNDLELSDDPNLNKRSFNFKVGDICLLGFSNSSDAFKMYDEDENCLGWFMFVNPNYIMAKYE
jgi:co-chaperonin GroES (HSP10)